MPITLCDFTHNLSIINSILTMQYYSIHSHSLIYLPKRLIVESFMRDEA